MSWTALRTLAIGPCIAGKASTGPAPEGCLLRTTSGRPARRGLTPLFLEDEEGVGPQHSEILSNMGDGGLQKVRNLLISREFVTPLLPICTPTG